MNIKRSKKHSRVLQIKKWKTTLEAEMNSTRINQAYNLVNDLPKQKQLGLNEFSKLSAMLMAQLRNIKFHLTLIILAYLDL